MTTTPATPTPAHRRALFAALADQYGRIPENTTPRVREALSSAEWVSEVTPMGVPALLARAAGYDGPFRLAINSSGRRALFTESQWDALLGVSAEGQLPAAPWPSVQALHRAGVVEYRDMRGRVQAHDGGGRNRAYLTYLGWRAVGQPHDLALAHVEN
ncbi:hypothetical protein QR97_01740 [Streptomyces sp. PBH53]|uniref:hypothetical protein n=1 Tax=Streptomyces sp. PBH53 TaxID=1577075 RepID=UPI0006552F8B|nr:hypothetical protein [Streptomyces sp. PBH53]AKN68694.1 hypothetical protein QR97_01740 [Streptomyces sp. PBH53]